MMYATSQDMIAAFGELEMIQLSDLDHLGVVNQTLVESALKRASADIDGYVGWLHHQPINASAQALELLKGLCCDMARYRLAGSNNRLATEEMRDRHKEAINMLKMIARGEVKLMRNDTPAPAQQDRVQILHGRSRIGIDLEHY